MSGGGKRRAAAHGAILVILAGLSATANQAGRGSAPVPGGSAAAGSTVIRDQPAPAAGNPDVKAKLDHDQNIKDAARLVQLATEIQAELDNSSQFTLSAATLKKADEMEKLSKKLNPA